MLTEPVRLIRVKHLKAPNYKGLLSLASLPIIPGIIDSFMTAVNLIHGLPNASMLSILN